MTTIRRDRTGELRLNKRGVPDSIVTIRDPRGVVSMALREEARLRARAEKETRR